MPVVTLKISTDPAGHPMGELVIEESTPRSRIAFSGWLELLHHLEFLVREQPAAEPPGEAGVAPSLREGS
jgi:hypothetical protein